MRSLSLLETPTHKHYSRSSSISYMDQYFWASSCCMFLLGTFPSSSAHILRHLLETNALIYSCRPSTNMSRCSFQVISSPLSCTSFMWSTNNFAFALFHVPINNSAKLVTPCKILPYTIWNGLIPVDLLTKFLYANFSCVNTISHCFGRSIVRQQIP